MAGRGQTATKGAAGSAKKKKINVMVPVEKEQLKQMHPAKRLVSVPVAKKQISQSYAQNMNRSTTEKRVNNTINREKGNILLTKQSNSETVRKYEDAFKNRKRGK